MKKFPDNQTPRDALFIYLFIYLFFFIISTSLNVVTVFFQLMQEKINKRKNSMVMGNIEMNMMNNTCTKECNIPASSCIIIIVISVRITVVS